MKKAIVGQKGFITIDYIFAFVLVMGFTAIVFALSMTLMVVEVTQYATFAAARTYEAANIDMQHQEDLGYKKFNQLKKNRVFAPFFSNGWFELGDFQLSSQGVAFPDMEAVQPASAPKNLFLGGRVQLTAHILDFNIPFFGPTMSETVRGQGGFHTSISSYLGRAPTTVECHNFSTARWKMIVNLNPQFSSAPAKNIALINDNGC